MKKIEVRKEGKTDVGDLTRDVGDLSWSSDVTGLHNRMVSLE